MSERAGWIDWMVRAGAALLGLVLLAAGLFKAWDPWLFVGALPAYGVPGPLALPIATVLPAIEIGVGLALLIGWRVRLAGMLAAGLFVVFAAAIGWGWGRGTLEECYCFGALLPREPWAALRQDLLLLAIAVATALQAPEPEGRHGGTAVRGVAVGLVAAAALVWAGAVLLLSADPYAEIGTDATTTGNGGLAPGSVAANSGAVEPGDGDTANR